ncbi:MAG TPA: HlyD family efflux transporter periplasmic adaptor subunit [Candidatus Ozemobacteraceae bacterium]|nr:HlyD family efflux transporter periplasmic adaptor subunit [Candidatus Ozemobacteraceae bacterium]
MTSGTRRPSLLLAILLAAFAAAHPAAAAEPRWYDGRVMPRDFHTLCAPRNTLRLPFWRSESGSIKLVSVAPEGKTVTAGEVVATFQFGDDEARSELDRQIARLKAKRDETLLGLRKSLVDLTAKLEKARIREHLAELDLGRKSSVSAQKQKLLDAEARLARLETETLEHKVAAATENIAKTDAILSGNIKTWTNHYANFDATRKRYTLEAPAAGFLFYPAVDKLKRKIAAGDEVSSGIHVLSVVTSDRVGIEFYVPEADLAQIVPGRRVRIAFDSREIQASIISMDFFPQRIGDVHDSFQLPNAWEKCFVVRAEPVGTLPLGTNNLVRVRLAP